MINRTRFGEVIEEVCRGNGQTVLCISKYFGKLPPQLLDLSKDLDELRVTRNNLGHYFGRRKDVYSAPIDFEPIETTRISHERILKYFKLIYSAAK